MSASTEAVPLTNEPGSVLLEPDDEEHTKADYAVGDDKSALTQSMQTSLKQSVQENGRSYHRYESISGKDYLLPNDDMEQERLDLQHEMFLQTFDGRLYNSPLEEDKIKNVLDVGTGTGVWAIDFAEDHPDAQVFGTDLSPIQPSYVPPNCKFEIDDMNEDWTFNQKFDFIHARLLAYATNDFPKLMKQAYDALVPGGWLEMPEVSVPIVGIDDTFKGTAVENWGERQKEACAKLGIDPAAAVRYKEWMVEAGFENVTEIKFKWPVGTWPKDPKAKMLGKLCLINTLLGMEAFTLRLWTGALGLSTEQVREDIKAVEADCKNPRIHSYWPMYTVYGQKPKGA